MKVTGSARVVPPKPFRSDTLPSGTVKNLRRAAQASLSRAPHTHVVTSATATHCYNAQVETITATATHCYSAQVKLAITNDMCIYSQFQYLCLHQKLKIIKACSKAFKDPHGVLTCPDAPNAHASAETPRIFGQRTYGLGICGSIHCAWTHNILPIGEYGDNTKFGNSTSFEDDTEIEDSPATREERVGRWFRLLSADQQLDHFTTEYPIPEHELSDAGQVLHNFPHGAHDFMALDTLRWQELNPLYLNPPMLQWCVLNHVLPASVVDDRKSTTITPRKPIFGPFQVRSSHQCPNKRGICNVCGKNIGDKEKKETVLAYRQSVELAKMLIETPMHEDLTGTAWDPNVELKWDDARGEYRTIPTNTPVSISDAPYPASSNPAFVPSTTQAVDTAAVFGGQNGYVADSSTYASAEYGLTGGMDWESFVMDAALDDQPPATSGNDSWLTSGFSGHDGLATMPQAAPDMANFSSNPSASFDANHDTTYKIDAGNQTNFDFGLSDPQFDKFTNAHPSELDTMMYQSTNNQGQIANQSSASHQTSEPLGVSTNESEHHMPFSNPDTVSQDVEPDFIDDPMITCDSGEDQHSMSVAFRPSMRQQ